jgi:hypothetical protein
MVFILAETAAGYAIFKAKDKALKNRKTIAENLASVEDATSMYISPSPPSRPRFLVDLIPIVVDFD